MSANREFAHGRVQPKTPYIEVIPPFPFSSKLSVSFIQFTNNKKHYKQSIFFLHAFHNCPTEKSVLLMLPFPYSHLHYNHLEFLRRLYFHRHIHPRKGCPRRTLRRL